MTASLTEREVRAARNQSLFRAVNEQIRQLNESFAAITNTFSVSCECADLACIDVLVIAPEDYESVRRNPRQFVVLPGHLDADAEIVVRETERFTVVEKVEAAAEVAEQLAPPAPAYP